MDRRREFYAVGGCIYLWFGSLCVLMMESACSPRCVNTRLYELQLLYSNRAGNGIGFSKGEMEVGKGKGGGQGVGDGDDGAGGARRAFEDDWTTVWGGGGGSCERWRRSEWEWEVH